MEKKFTRAGVSALGRLAREQSTPVEVVDGKLCLQHDVDGYTVTIVDPEWRRKLGYLSRRHATVERLYHHLRWLPRTITAPDPEPEPAPMNSPVATPAPEPEPMNSPVATPAPIPEPAPYPESAPIPEAPKITRHPPPVGASGLSTKAARRRVRKHLRQLRKSGRAKGVRSTDSTD